MSSGLGALRLSGRLTLAGLNAVMADLIAFTSNYRLRACVADVLLRILKLYPHVCISQTLFEEAI